MNLSPKIKNQIPARKQVKWNFKTKKKNLSEPVCSFLDQTAFLQRNLGNQAFQRSYHSGLIQPMLKMNEPGDEYEQEADRVADDVMRMTDEEALHLSQSGLRIQRKCSGCTSGGGACSDCADEEEGVIQPKEISDQTSPLFQGLENQIHSIRGNGQPLPESLRNFFEPRFGADFGQVRVHADSRASETAKQISARAFTVGKDVVFGVDEYSPNSREGRRLIAHELTHVLQQGAFDNNVDKMAVQCSRSYTDCSNDEESTIESAASQGQTDLDTSISALDTRPLTSQVEDALFLAFRSNTASTARDVKEKLQDIRDGITDVTFECEHPDDILYSRFCPTNRYGYVRSAASFTGIGSIHLCMHKFPGMGAISQARAVLHEASHLLANTSDHGYLGFPNCHETGQTAGDPPSERLDNADSYACFVHYIAHSTASTLSPLAQSYAGSGLFIAQSTTGTIDLSSGTPKDPMFEVTGIPTNSGFAYRWVIDVDGDRYMMWSDEGSVFHYGSSSKAYIPSGTRALMSSRGITSARILCRVRLWRHSFSGGEPDTILLEKPVTFTP